MNKLKLTILFLFMSLAASAQRLAVESLKLRPNDLSARNVKNQRHDLNGMPCALLKVMVMDNITKCSSGNIGDIVTEGPVKLIYITSATPSIELSFQYHYPITINFADYGYKHLEGNSTYELNLVDELQMMLGNGNLTPNTQSNNVSQNSITTVTPANKIEESANKVEQSTSKVEESDSQSNNAQQNTDNTNDAGRKLTAIEVAELVKVGEEFYDIGLYSSAFKKLHQAAEQGHVPSQYNIGVMYKKGQGVDINLKEAAKWYLKAANQGYTEAQYNIGAMLYEGKGVEQNYKEAFNWFLKAANSGNVPSQYNIGVMYKKGQGVDINLKEAAKWYLKAANQGYTEAQYNIGAMLYEGKGVEQNYKEAFNWFLKAANSGNVNAQRKLGSMYIDGEGVVSDFDQAVYWFKKGAEQGDEDCKATLKLLVTNNFLHRLSKRTPSALQKDSF